MFYEVGVGKKFLIHSQIMEDLNEKTHNFNIINIKILFLSKTKKRRKICKDNPQTGEGCSNLHNHVDEPPEYMIFLSQ